MPTRRAHVHDTRRAPGHRSHRAVASRRLLRRRPQGARVRRLHRLSASRSRDAPRRHGAGVPRDRRDLFRTEPARRRVRHRDPRLGRQHAGALRGARAVLQVLRRRPQVPHQRGVLPDDRSRWSARPRRRGPRHRVLRARGGVGRRGPRRARPALGPALVVSTDLQLHREPDQPLRVRDRARGRPAFLRAVRDGPSSDGQQAAPRRPDGRSPPRPRRARLRRGLATHQPGPTAPVHLPRVRPAHRRVDHDRRLRGSGAGAVGRPAVVLRLRIQARRSSGQRRTPGDDQEEAQPERPTRSTASRQPH